MSKDRISLSLDPELLTKLRVAANANKRFLTVSNLIELLCVDHLDGFIKKEIERNYGADEGRDLIKRINAAVKTSTRLPRSKPGAVTVGRTILEDPIAGTASILTFDGMYDFLTKIPPENKKNKIFHDIISYLEVQSGQNNGVTQLEIQKHLRDYHGHRRGTGTSNISQLLSRYPQFVYARPAWREDETGEPWDFLPFIPSSGQPGIWYLRNERSRDQWVQHAYAICEYLHNKFVKNWAKPDGNYSASTGEIARAIASEVELSPREAAEGGIDPDDILYIVEAHKPQLFLRMGEDVDDGYCIANVQFTGVREREG